jgi:hypothetical protein
MPIVPKVEIETEETETDEFELIEVHPGRKLTVELDVDEVDALYRALELWIHSDPSLADERFDRAGGLAFQFAHFADLIPDGA